MKILDSFRKELLKLDGAEKIAEYPKVEESLKESFPAGTKLFKGGQFTAFKKVLYEVTAEINQIFTIKNK